MANDKTYDRHVNIWINGKEVVNNISSIKKEMLNLTNETAKATRGTTEYNEKVAELKKVKAILKEHQDNIASTETSWSKLKKSFGAVQIALMAGLGVLAVAWKGAKEVIASTDILGDKFERTIGGWKGGLDAFARSLATINEGGLKNLGKKIREGIDEGRRYADSLDSIDEKTRALQIAESEASNEILKQTEISRSNTHSKEEQIAAGKKIIQLEEDLTKIRTGIANQGYLNESKNIQNATHLTEAQLLSYAKQEEQMVANIARGKEYNDMVKQKNELENSIRTDAINRIAISETEVNTVKELTEKIAGATEETKRFAFAAANMPGDEKMQLFSEKYVAYQQAIGSGLENTMRTRVRVANNEDKLNKDAIKGLEDKTKTENKAALETAQIAQDVADYKENLDKEYFKALDKKTKKENEAALESAQIAQDVRDVIEKTDDDYQKNKEKKEKAIADNDQKLLEAKKKTTQAAQNFISAIFDRQFSKLDEQYKKDIAAAGDNAVLKAKIEEDYAKKKNALARRAAIFEKAAALVSIGISVAKGIAEATAAAVATLGASLLLIPWIIAAGVIQAAAVVAKPIPEFSSGGFTASGSKHEPAGIVHTGEYVVNAEMVASPVTGPVIRALEDYRINNLPGYANGGGPDISSSGSGTGGSAAGLIATDPELKAILRGVGRFLSKLDRDGVNMKFGWNEADNVKKGLNKLNDIEDSVKM